MSLQHLKNSFQIHYFSFPLFFSHLTFKQIEHQKQIRNIKVNKSILNILQKNHKGADYNKKICLLFKHLIKSLKFNKTLNTHTFIHKNTIEFSTLLFSVLQCFKEKKTLIIREKSENMTKKKVLNYITKFSFIFNFQNNKKQAGATKARESSKK